MSRRDGRAPDVRNQSRGPVVSVPSASGHAQQDVDQGHLLPSVVGADSHGG